MMKTLLLVGTLGATLSTRALAQDSDRKFQAGIRSALITGTMELSGLDAAFDDLEPDGLTGPHMSGFFLTYRVRPYLRVGVETLVASSDKGATTSMNYQAAGSVVEVTYGKTWFVSSGVHAGGLIVNAMARQAPDPAEGASSGAFFKGDGAFFAPYVDVGYRFRRSELGLFVKQVNVFGEQERGGISEFSSSFVGLRFSVGL